MRHVLTLLLLSLITGTASSEVLCPRVTSQHNADVTDLGRFRNYHQWRELRDEKLAIAVWQYLCDQETGLFHMSAVTDGTDRWSEYSTVRDPVKLLNVYNVGFCGIFGPTLDGIFQGVGFRRGRAFGLPGWNHCTTEVWYDDAWHYFDLDVRGALTKPDGSIASVAEAQKDRALWVSPQRKIEPFFPKDRDKARVFEIYRDSRIDYFYRWFQMGHVMDFRLRQGETLTRWWHPQNGRWHHLENFNTGFVRKLLEKPPVGYKSNHPDFSVWTQGNGLWHYEPNLTASSTDFADGIRTSHNLQPGDGGLEFITSGEGSAELEIFTPWIIVPKVNHLEDPNDDAEASVITLDTDRPVTVMVSLDHGKTWKETMTIRGGRHAVDLTPWVKGTHGFLVKLQTAGRAGQLAWRAMKIRTWVQVAPVSLPRLKQGPNHCRYEIGDRYGGQTMPMFVLPNVADPEDLKKHVVTMPKDYDLQRKTARIRGDVILKLQAPPGSTIDWFTAGACFNTYQNEGAEKTDNRIAFAVAQPHSFRQIYQANVPTWVNHWRYQWDQDVRLPEPAESVFVKYTGRPGVNVLRATVHLKPDKPPARAIRITHAYRVGDKLTEHQVDLEDEGDYVVNVDGEPANVYLRMAVPSK